MDCEPTKPVTEGVSRSASERRHPLLPQYLVVEQGPGLLDGKENERVQCASDTYDLDQNTTARHTHKHPHYTVPSVQRGVTGRMPHLWRRAAFPPCVSDQSLPLGSYLTHRRTSSGMIPAQPGSPPLVYARRTLRRRHKNTFHRLSVSPVLAKSD